MIGVIRSDGWWRFACGDVSFCPHTVDLEGWPTFAAPPSTEYAPSRLDLDPNDSNDQRDMHISIIIDCTGHTAFDYSWIAEHILPFLNDWASGWKMQENKDIFSTHPSVPAFPPHTTPLTFLLIGWLDCSSLNSFSLEPWLPWLLSRSHCWTPHLPNGRGPPVESIVFFCT